ncbi:hypothetical protein IMG5_102620 [Ichthyophthirius multifiliis]|uniref:Uncharacterized protein n=1 Tax=Ichthyophthirius multifiliis TaxID=5932 RepID=G0QSP6_ICHMU|nr:hypothetical protein IMG5_102620 [Ichthyophthirius multifiliis]EGR31762.1 hypothetical protein IMG5_102620 [Ichthyophthirius multifiliis]|eukprot:XP_004035248.1 hypothetical protein IMG5_102620 [Ichthyophthirius multifiliis]
MNTTPEFIYNPLPPSPYNVLWAQNKDIKTDDTTPYMIPASVNPKKSSVTICIDDSNEMINLQAQRIAMLEERCDLLTKQYQRYYSGLKNKDDELKHWKNRCDLLQSHLKVPYTRIEELQSQKNEVKKDQIRMVQILKNAESELENLIKLSDQKEKDIAFWKERAKKAEKTQTIIMSLEHRIRILGQENNRLNSLITEGSRYKPPQPFNFWQQQ